MWGWRPVLGLEPSPVLIGIGKGDGGDRKESALGKRSSSQSSAPQWCNQPRHRAAHGEQPRNQTKVGKLRLDLREMLLSAADTKCQLHSCFF